MIIELSEYFAKDRYFSESAVQNIIDLINKSQLDENQLKQIIETCNSKIKNSSNSNTNLNSNGSETKTTEFDTYYLHTNNQQLNDSEDIRYYFTEVFLKYINKNNNDNIINYIKGNNYNAVFKSKPSTVFQKNNPDYKYPWVPMRTIAIDSLRSGLLYQYIDNDQSGNNNNVILNDKAYSRYYPIIKELIEKITNYLTKYIQKNSTMLNINPGDRFNANTMKKYSKNTNSGLYVKYILLPGFKMEGKIYQALVVSD